MDTEQAAKLLKELQWTRNMLDQGKKWIADTQAELEQNETYKRLKELKEEQAAYQKKVDETYEILTSWAEENFDGNKYPVKGIEIKDNTEVILKDEKAAKAWAAVNAPAILTINMTKFKPAVKNLELDFVEIKTTPKAYISSDLSEYNV